MEEMKKDTSKILVSTNFTSTLQVAVRLRPLNKKEHENNHFEIIRILDQKVVILMDPAEIMGEN